MARRDRPPLILLPPSEGKAPGGDGAAWAPATDRFEALDDSRERVFAVLARSMSTNATARARLLGVTGDLLDRATAANGAARTAPTRPAIERFTGVLYDALDHPHLPASSKRRAANQLVIASGLFGLVAPTTPIPDHRIKISATLPRLGKLSTWWRPHLTAALMPLVEDRTVWDLLPNEHAAAWSPAATSPARRLSVRFLDDVGTGSQRRLITVSHWNKLLKGALVRHILATQLDDLDGLIDFDHPEGYRYRPDLTEQRNGATVVALVARRS